MTKKFLCMGKDQGKWYASHLASSRRHRIDGSAEGIDVVNKGKVGKFLGINLLNVRKRKTKEIR